MDISKMSINSIRIAVGGSQDLKLSIVENMETYGGSFVKALARCVLIADYQNLDILVKNFTHYFIEYRPEAWVKK